jgi:hypothetical protein
MTIALAAQPFAPATGHSLLAQVESDPNLEAAAGIASLLMIVFLLGVAILYFVPIIVACVRHHPNTPAIVLLNLLAGWTFIGWVGSLVWSLTNPQTPNTTVYVQAGAATTSTQLLPPPPPPGVAPFGRSGLAR